MENNTFYLIVKYFAKSIFFAIVYITILLVTNRKIKNRFIKAIVIGIITPFIAHKFIMNFMYPFSFFLYFLRIYDPNIAILIISLLSKRISLILGIIVAIFLLIKEDLIKAFKEDISSFLNNDSNSKKR